MVDNLFLLCDIVYDKLHNNPPIILTIIQKLVNTLRNVNNSRYWMKVVGKTQLVGISILLGFQILTTSMMKLIKQNILQN